MTEKTITFTPKAELKKGFFCLLRGFVLIFRSIGRLMDHAVRRYPWAFLVTTVLISVILCFFFVGKARSERDATSKRNYELQQKIDTLQMVNEAKAEVRYVNAD